MLTRHATPRHANACRREQTKITKLLEALVAVFMHPKERAKALDRALWDEDAETWTLPRIKPRAGYLARSRPGDAGGGLLGGAPRGARAEHAGGKGSGGFASYGGGGEGEAYGGEDWGEEVGGAVVIDEGEERAAEAAAIRGASVGALPALPAPRPPHTLGGFLGGASLPAIGVPAEARTALYASAPHPQPLSFPSLERGGARAGGAPPLPPTTRGLGLAALPGIGSGVGRQGKEGPPPLAGAAPFSLPLVGGAGAPPRGSGGGGGALGGASLPGIGGGLGGSSLPGIGSGGGGGSGGPSWTAALGLDGAAQSAVESFFSGGQPLMPGGGLGSSSLPSIGGSAPQKRR